MMGGGTSTPQPYPQPPCVEGYGTPYPKHHQPSGVDFPEGVGWLSVGVRWRSVGGQLVSVGGQVLTQICLPVFGPRTGPKT